ncbi:MAG: hypothetical protein R3B84_11950 [Zavarzinella sp.]
MNYTELLDIVRSDPRYPVAAYVFTIESLDYTSAKITHAEEVGDRTPGHITGREFVLGMIEFARKELGVFARTFFELWNIQTRDDIGEIVFNLIDAEFLSKTESDQRSDFHNLLSLEQALTEGVTIHWDSTAALRRRVR